MMRRLSPGRRAAAAVGVLASLAGAASFVRSWRSRKATATDVKQIARRLAEDPWRGKLDQALEFIGEDYIAYVPGSLEPFRGKQGFREFVTAYLTAFPDGALAVDDQIAEGNMVATRWTGRGTHTGELMGMPATGRQITTSGISYTRIVDGRAREAWISWDTLGLLQQLGVIPEMIAAPRST